MASPLLSSEFLNVFSWHTVSKQPCSEPVSKAVRSEVIFKPRRAGVMEPTLAMLPEISALVKTYNFHTVSPAQTTKKVPLVHLPSFFSMG